MKSCHYWVKSEKNGIGQQVCDDERKLYGMISVVLPHNFVTTQRMAELTKNVHV